MSIMTMKKWKIEIKNVITENHGMQSPDYFMVCACQLPFHHCDHSLRKNNIWASAKAELEQKNTDEESYALDNQRALGDGGRKGPLGKIFPELPQSPASSVGLPAYCKLHGLTHWGMIWSPLSNATSCGLGLKT